MRQDELASGQKLSENVKREWNWGLTFGWSETLVISCRSTNVQVMKKMLSKQDGSGVYQMYIKMMPSIHTTYAVVASSITWMWLQHKFIINQFRWYPLTKMQSNRKKKINDGSQVSATDNFTFRGISSTILTILTFAYFSIAIRTMKTSILHEFDEVQLKWVKKLMSYDAHQNSYNMTLL